MLARYPVADVDAVPAAQVQEELICSDGRAGVVPEERVLATAGRGVDEFDIAAQPDGDDVVLHREDDGRFVGCWVGGGGGRGWTGGALDESEFLDADAVDGVGEVGCGEGVVADGVGVELASDSD